MAMGKVYTGASMSLDGYIASPADPAFEHLFRWYGNGDIAVQTADPQMTMRMTTVGAQPPSATCSRSPARSSSAARCSTRSMAGAATIRWACRSSSSRTAFPTAGRAMTRRLTSSTTGIEAAVALARQLAGDKVVGVNGGVIAGQCLDAGLLDEIWVDLVPVLLGSGTPLFLVARDRGGHFEGPIAVTPDDDVTHLRYRVRK